jgi:hypothetical protein
MVINVIILVVIIGYYWLLYGILRLLVIIVL